MKKVIVFHFFALLTFSSCSVFAQKAPKEKGFVSLFNGENLEGWIGNKSSYRAENGMIVINPKGEGGGNLYTENEYGDFLE